MFSIIAYVAFVIFVHFLSAYLTESHWKRQAILHGAARHVIDDDGRPKFFWNDNLTEEKK